jgi:hypothetical protein
MFRARSVSDPAFERSLAVEAMVINDLAEEAKISRGKLHDMHIRIQSAVFQSDRNPLGKKEEAGKSFSGDLFRSEVNRQMIEELAKRLGLSETALDLKKRYAMERFNTANPRIAAQLDGKMG